MKLIVTLRDSSLGEKERQYALDRITHLQQYFERLTSAEVILSVEATRKHRMRAEFVVHANRGAILVAQAEDASMFAAIDRAHSEMKREVLRHKERLVDHHRARRAAAARRARGAA
ncbi:MAG: ribosome-associated translation inhibitor RaiA [Planctomycetes bacterium]|nr:ribosome-associated translation inhibitor RaiA [Planctomycetota bacterium]